MISEVKGLWIVVGGGALGVVTGGVDNSKSFISMG